MTAKAESPKPRASSRFRLYALAGAVMCLGLAWACDGYDSHIYSGEAFESARNCIDQPSSVDVVDGVTPTAPCAPLCLVLPTYDGEGGTEAYVSSMCPPLPPAADTTQLDPRCPPALAAYNRDDFCLDSGSTNPPGSGPPDAAEADAADAGADDAGDGGGADAAPDAAADAAPDAAPDAAIVDAGADADAGLDSGL